MDYNAHVTATQTALDAFCGALDKGPLDALVPTCPKFDLAGLTKHVGEFSGFWTHVLCEAIGREKTPFPDFPSEAALVPAWFGGLAADLVRMLRTTGPDTTCWTWVPDRPNVAFVGRRCAHELSVHRYDAQLAVGSAEPIEARTAADGIDEIFVMIAAWDGESRRRGTNGNGETLHVHSNEGDEWMITLSPTGVVVDRAHGKADLALRGAVSDLELKLFQRPTIGEVEMIGDESALDAWYRAFTFG